MSLESILRAVPGLSPHDRRKMLQAAGEKKNKDATVSPHDVRAAINKARLGGLGIHHVEAIISALQDAGLVSDET